jgi:transposase-like protein
VPKSKPSYSDEFRQGAVDLLLSSGRALTRVAEELGVAPNTLRAWRDEALCKGGAAKVDSGAGTPVADAAAEIRRLQKEVDYLRRQREILKKALSILGEDPQNGMR